MTLDALLDHFDTTRYALLADAAALEAAMLGRRPTPDAWSVLEIVEHLVRAERWVFHDLRPLDEIPERTPWFKQRLRRRIVMAVLGSRFRVAVPESTMHPTGSRSLEECRADWDTNQRWLRGIIAQLGPRGLHRHVLRHPVAGPLTVEQGVRMGQVHLERHWRQLREVRRLLGPSAA